MRHKYLITLICISLFRLTAVGQTTITISNPESWTVQQLSQYVGQTVTFLTPLYITNNYNYSQGRYSLSAHRVYSPTNQAYPLSAEYSDIVRLNNSSEVTLSGVSGYHRMGERVVGLTARVNSTNSLTLVGEFRTESNTREDMLRGIPSVDIKGMHRLLVCAFNLEYYLVQNIGQGMGPRNETQSARQHQKIMQALTTIGADIYGLLEIEQGQVAIKKLADGLTAATGKRYTYIDDGTSPSGTYTKSAYLYCSETVTPVGPIRHNNTGVSNRKKMQAFRENSTGEVFIFSINHFKAKTNSGATGLNADQGDGQGCFNHDRVTEAKSVISQYEDNRSFYDDDDVLIMGDLNAYAKEDPITTLIEGGMIDLHRYFHADSSYSYVYRNQAGYLDHALANSTMLRQVTGMAAYHINSDEHDGFTYDKSENSTMFRSSDHDPVLVGLSLNKDAVIPIAHPNSFEVLTGSQPARIIGAMGGHYTLHDSHGYLLTEGAIPNDDYYLPVDLGAGLYILTIFHDTKTQTYKIIKGL